MEGQDLDILASQVAELITNAQKVVAFTGAGHSTESGIPDFRSPGGLWDRFDPRDFTYQKFLTDPEGRKKMWEVHREGILIGAEPNPAHYAIAELCQLGKLDSVITQNVDYLLHTFFIREFDVVENAAAQEGIREFLFRI